MPTIIIIQAEGNIQVHLVLSTMERVSSIVGTASKLFVMSVLFISISSTEASQTSVYLDNNSGYRGVIVSFSPEMQSSQRETVLLRLQVSYFYFYKLHSPLQTTNVPTIGFRARSLISHSSCFLSFSSSSSTHTIF